MPAGGGLPIMPAGGPIVAGVNDWVSFCVAGGIPPVWAPPIACSFSSALGALPAILPGALTYQQKAQMVLDRESIGIPVKFLLGLVIGAVALGMPVVPGGLVEQYLKRAFGGGGYSSPMAIMLYRLRYNPIVFPFLGLPGGGMPTLVVLHIRIPCRVSKNMKELHCNSFSDPVTVNQAGPAPFIPPPPAVPPPPGAYVSIKFNIDNIWAGLGLLPPSSATVVSYDAVPKK
jgi:hypothetical protein